VNILPLHITQDGDLVLLEFSEEYPPLVSNVGMATKFVNFFKVTERPLVFTVLLDLRW
jgi:hypothetical protein